MSLETDRLRGLAEAVFAMPESEGTDKVVPLARLIRENVEPGMAIVFQGAPSAAHYQIVREFYGKEAGFTLISPLPCIGLDLVHCGLARKVIASNFGELRPTPRSSHIWTRAYRGKSVEYEVWSLMGLSLGLMAGALGVGFMPMRGMVGTSMAADNAAAFKTFSDPFGSGKEVGLVKALNPDLAIVHVWACDRYGNSILTPTVAGIGLTNWAFFAARNVIVTAEKLVSTEFLRRHAYLVGLPGYRVSGVSVVPLGAHPLGVYNWGLKEFETYGDDIDFQIEHQKATEAPPALDAWLSEWVLGCHRPEDYLSKLGYDRITFLKGKGSRDLWRYQLDRAVEKVSTGSDYTAVEMMIVAAARKIQEVVKKNGYRVLLCGQGASGMASWLAGYELSRQGYDVDMATGNGLFGVRPRPGAPFLVTVDNLATCKMLTDCAVTYPLIVCGEHRRSLSIFSAAQIDRHGNLNAGKVSDRTFLQGPGGAGDGYQASEVVVVLAQTKERLCEILPYVTSAGKNVKTLVTDLGVFQKLDGDELVLTACLPAAGSPGLDGRVRLAREKCGWNLKTAPRIAEVAPPTFEELMTVRLFDPDDYFRH